MDINIVIKELLFFSDEVLTLNKPASENSIAEFERKYKFSLPADYKYLLTKFNGFDLLGIRVFGIYNAETSNSIDGAYNFEHFSVDNPMFDYLIPFSPDGGGNHYCFDTRHKNETSCDIIFWQHDFIYNVKELPEKTNNSFAEWLNEVVIDWTLEDYDYMGNER